MTSQTTLFVPAADILKLVADLLNAHDRPDGCGIDHVEAGDAGLTWVVVGGVVQGARYEGQWVTCPLGALSRRARERGEP